MVKDCLLAYARHIRDSYKPNVLPAGQQFIFAGFKHLQITPALHAQSSKPKTFATAPKGKKKYQPLWQRGKQHSEDQLDAAPKKARPRPRPKAKPTNTKGKGRKEESSAESSVESQEEIDLRLDEEGNVSDDTLPDQDPQPPHMMMELATANFMGETHYYKSKHDGKAVSGL